MKTVTAGLLLVGLVLLGIVVYQTDLAEVWRWLGELGGWGMAVILGVHLIAFMTDSLTWHLALPSVPLTLNWFYRLNKVMLVGEAFNRMTPLASIGGEPIKAVLAKKHYGIGYRDTTTSLVLMHTIFNIALIVFLLIGLLLLSTSATLPAAYQRAAGLGMAGFSVCILLFFLVQRHKVFSRLGGWLGRGRLGARLLQLIELVHDLEDRLIAYYTGDRRRFALAVAVAFLNWVLGMLEIYYTLWFLGHPVTLADAWVIEASVVLVRSALFFVPGNLGTQEGTLVVICGAMTGSPALGFAVAVVARCREIIWTLWGFALGWHFSVNADEVPRESMGTAD